MWKNIVSSSPGVIRRQRISHRSIRLPCVSVLWRSVAIEENKKILYGYETIGSDLWANFLSCVHHRCWFIGHGRLQSLQGSRDPLRLLRGGGSCRWQLGL